MVDEETGTTTKSATEGHRTRWANLIAGGCCRETVVDHDRPSIELKTIFTLLSQKDKSLAQPVKQFWSTGPW
jgi:hypothetical protein